MLTDRMTDMHLSDKRTCSVNWIFGRQKSNYKEIFPKSVITICKLLIKQGTQVVPKLLPIKYINQSAKLIS